MFHFLKRLLGWECCKGGEFTQWRTMEATYTRPPRDMIEKVTAGMVDTISYTVTYQERHCTICGKTQQRKLKW